MGNSSPKQMIFDYDKYSDNTVGISVGANQQINFMYKSAGDDLVDLEHHGLAENGYGGLHVFSYIPQAKPNYFNNIYRF